MLVLEDIRHDEGKIEAALGVAAVKFAALWRGITLARGQKLQRYLVRDMHNQLVDTVDGQLVGRKINPHKGEGLEEQ